MNISPEFLVSSRRIGPINIFCSNSRDGYRMILEKETDSKRKFNTDVKLKFWNLS